jgi:hypothetical protein
VPSAFNSSKRRTSAASGALQVQKADISLNLEYLPFSTYAKGVLHAYIRIRGPPGIKRRYCILQKYGLPWTFNSRVGMHKSNIISEIQ